MKYKCTFCKHKQNTWNKGRCKKCTCMLELIKMKGGININGI